MRIPIGSESPSSASGARKNFRCDEIPEEVASYSKALPWPVQNALPQENEASRHVARKSVLGGMVVAKVIITEREITSCADCDFRRSIIPFIEQIKQAAVGIYCDPLKCTRKRPHKPIKDSESIPEWCPLPDSKF